jgi:hypothetical protein
VSPTQNAARNVPETGKTSVKLKSAAKALNMRVDRSSMIELMHEKKSNDAHDNNMRFT